MRIVYVTETYPPEINGVALTAARTVAYLRDMGHDIQVLRPRQRGETAHQGVGEWRCAGFPLPMYSELRFGWIRASVLRECWLRDPPDLVHVATPGPLGRTALRCAAAAGIATSAEFRTNFHAYSRHYGLGWIEPLVLKYLRHFHGHADCNFAPTPALAGELRESGFPRFEVIGRGVDARRFSPRRRDAALRRQWGARADDCVMLYVGRLAAEKNVDLALRTWQGLHRRDATLHLVVVGDGPQRVRLQADRDGMVYTGVLQGDALSRCYASADVFLFPSLTDTYGNVTLEAMASGLSVVAYDTAAARVHVTDGVNGWLARPGDEPGYMDAARRAIAHCRPGDPVRRAARAAALRADWPSTLAAFERRLCEVVAAAAARRAQGPTPVRIGRRRGTPLATAPDQEVST